jgi:copper chaperone
MIVFHVPDMTCGHCASTITQALQRIDCEAKLQIDLRAHRVHIEATTVDAKVLAEAIREAGYTPAPAQ